MTGGVIRTSSIAMHLQFTSAVAGVTTAALSTASDAGLTLDITNFTASCTSEPCDSYSFLLHISPVVGLSGAVSVAVDLSSALPPAFMESAVLLFTYGVP